MKSKYVVLASALLISVASFAQKTKLKLLKSVKKRKLSRGSYYFTGAESLCLTQMMMKSPVFLCKRNLPRFGE
jgi:hypothetical protein